MLGKVLVVAAVVAGVASAEAFAVTPKAGQWSSGGEGGAGFTVSGAKILKGATVPSAFRCNKVNAVVPSSVKIAGGKASYSGSLKGQPGKLKLSVVFTSGSAASVTATITKGSCKNTAKAKVTLLGAASLG